MTWSLFLRTFVRRDLEGQIGRRWRLCRPGLANEWLDALPSLTAWPMIRRATFGRQSLGNGQRIAVSGRLALYLGQYSVSYRRLF